MSSHHPADHPLNEEVGHPAAPAAPLASAWPVEQKDESLAIDWPTQEPALGESALSSSATATDSAAAMETETAEPLDLVGLLGLTEQDPEFIEVFLEEACGELASIREQLAIWQQNLSNREPITAIRRAFHTLKGSGRMVGATTIGNFAWEYEELLNRILSGALQASLPICEAIAAAVTALSPLVGETPLRGGELTVLPGLIDRAKAFIESGQTERPSLRLTPVEPATRRSVPAEQPSHLPVLKPADTAVSPPPSAITEVTEATEIIETPEAAQITETPEAAQITEAAEPAGDAEFVDAEFMEVFLEEARSELDAISEQLPSWQRNLSDRQAQSTIRRAFHTLKGSGRVVGATEIGDLAWEFENLLHQAQSGAVVASPAMIDLVGEGVALLRPLVTGTSLTAERKAEMAALAERTQAFLLEKPPISSGPVADQAIHPPELASTAPLESPAQLEPAPPASAMTAPSPAADLELLEAFQYEAAEILDASDLILQQLAAETDHTALLNDLRRNMHTLKGGSRMADLLSIGDLAHAAESVLDALGKGAGQAEPVVLDALQQTLDRLNRMVVEAAGGINPPAAADVIGSLQRLADAITSSQSLTELLLVTPVTELSAAEPSTAEEVTADITEPSAFQSMTELDQELIQVFQTEASEILDSSDTIVQRLRTDFGNVELLNNLRREMHTLKGSSRMAGFMVVGELAHAAESILDALGKGTLEGSSRVLELIQRALDSLHQMLAKVIAGEQPIAPQDLLEALQSVSDPKPDGHSQAAPLPAVTATVTPTAAPRLPEKAAAASATETIRVNAALLNTLVNQMGESSIFRARVDQGVNAMSFNLGEMEQTIARLRRQITNLATQAEARIQSRHDQAAATHQQEFDPLELDRFTELQQVSRSLMEIADDLGNIGTSLGDHAREVTSLLDQQGKVNKEIQQSLMRTGMVRFGSIVSRLRRVVRQSAQELGKRAELLVDGEDAEVDRVVLESMVAPLEHMLRNSMAHGIEIPEVRRQRNKPEIGAISLSLRREGAELVLELNDDGAGLNFAAIRAKGQEKGFLSPNQSVSNEELIALLLRPGFSTATAITQISGRGVGMDVVNEAIRAMRGALLIQTEPGQGSRFIIRLPFSLAVTQALLAQAGDSLFAIPLLSIELVTRLNESDFQAYLAGESAQYHYGEHSYPIHNLGLLTGAGQVKPFEEVADRRPPALLFRSAEASAALQIEGMLGNHEIIVKPVGPQFNGVPGISGATVLADGRVVVVLELAALVRNAASQGQRQLESQALRVAQQETRQDKLTVMVIDDSITMRKVTSRILERHNIEATTAKDGMEAVAMLQSQVPDLAILDIEMPRMDGFEVVAHVRNQPHLKHMPIIMVTSRGGDKHRERAMKLGVNDYLTKPYQEDQLMQSIRTILGERALELIT